MVDTFDMLPDVVIADSVNNCLFLIEAATSHGPIDDKRYDKLTQVFGNSQADLISVSAFKKSRAIARSVSVISRETVAWIADEPDHLIHFNGIDFSTRIHDLLPAHVACCTSRLIV